MAESCNADDRQQRSEEEISFHKYPEKQLRKKCHRPIAMRREEQTPSSSKLSWSCHSRETKYDSPPRVLRKNSEHHAVSSFDLQENLQTDTEARSILKKRSYIEMSSGTNTASNQTSRPVSDCKNTSAFFRTEGRFTNLDSTTVPQKKRCFYLDDFNYDNRTQYSKDELVRFMCLARAALAQKNRLIKLLKQKKRRQQKKIDSLTSLLRYLQNKNRTIPDAA